MAVTNYGDIGGSGAPFGASGPGHSVGAVPDPGAVAGTTKFLREDATFQTIAGGGDALTSGNLSQFAATTSAQFAGVISDEVGTGKVILQTSPTLVTPALGVATATSVNKVAITAPATASTLTIQDGFTLTVSGNATVSGTHTGTATGTNTGDQTVSTMGGTGALTDGTGTLLIAHGGTSTGTATGSGNLVLATSPTLTTPTLGVATATTVNKVTITAPASASTLTIADGVTLTCSATVDTNNLAPKVSPTLTTPTLGVASATTINKVTITAPATASTLTIQDGFTLTANGNATVSGTSSGTNTGDVANTAVTTGTLAQFAATTSAQLAGVLSDETGSGAAVFATSPTLVTPVLGVASATSLATNKITTIKEAVFVAVPTANKTGAAPNLADWTTGYFQEIVLTGNVTGTPTFTAPSGTARLTLRVKQDGTGSRTVASWPSGVRWPGGTAPTLSTGASAIDYITFLYDGTNYDGLAAAGTTGAWA